MRGDEVTKRLLTGLFLAGCMALPAQAAEITPPDALAKSVTEDVLAVLG